MLHGIDVSDWLGAVDWAAHRQAGVSFAFVRATEGDDGHDRQFARNWEQTRSHGLLRGACHRARPGRDPLAEAGHFLAAVRARGFLTGDLLALQLQDAGGRDPEAVAAYARAWCSHVTGDAGVRPLVLTHVAFARAGHCAGLGGYPLWLAAHGDAPGRPAVPQPWDDWAVHQHAASPVDHNVFKGPAVRLRSLGLGGPAEEEIMKRLCVLGMSIGERQTVAGGSAEAIEYNVEFIDLDNLHADGGSSISPKVTRDYHLWARATIEGLKEGDRVTLHFSRYHRETGEAGTEVHREDRIGDGGTISVALYCFDHLDDRHRVRFRVSNANDYPVTVTESQFRLAT
ncbi:glycoside hydrolase family 25 protein [Bailinhaonella thermotolerans]|uniref:Uncharacterized protein n=1 Tax=Bailinhaonella thermotolerans TaxID=1070861 RepID=A0A3A4AZK1_9ACTN|nr:glycoside hydrolase family 25 protein [Bailinhaonella thermotolerans]RJL34009.1 hypothetical protein D5H75_05660 [Bailinhaonella thermotolerans]